MDINSILLSTGLSTSIFIIYKIVNNYRLKSECNQNNQLVISVVEPIQQQQQQPVAHHAPIVSEERLVEITVN